jgi:hypothetical protein
MSGGVAWVWGLGLKGCLCALCVRGEVCWMRRPLCVIWVGFGGGRAYEGVIT